MLRVLSFAVVLVLGLVAQGCVNITLPSGGDGDGRLKIHGDTMQPMAVPPGAKPVAIRVTGQVVTVLVTLEFKEGFVDFKADEGGSITFTHERTNTKVDLPIEPSHRQLLQTSYDKLKEGGFTVLVGLDFPQAEAIAWEPQDGDKFFGYLVIPYRRNGASDNGRCDLKVVH